MDGCIEITIEWQKGQENATVTAYNNSRIKNKILKLAEKNPEEVKIVTTNDGSIVAHIPIKYVKISPPKQVSDEQREAMRERMTRTIS